MLYEFGTCILDTERRLLTRNGHPVVLPPKTFDLLLLLLESGGRALSKAELMHALWPDMFVEEANLSFQVSTLRKALGENGPGWIETVPKHGYRFAATVSKAATRATAVAANSRRYIWLAAAVLLLAAGAVAFVLARGGATRERVAPHTPIPLTAYPGVQGQPSLSPDGSQVAFSWNGPNEDNFDIYVKLVGPGEPVRLTTAAARDAAPSWSPDGRQIAFLRFTSRQQASVIVIPALGGGVEHKIADILFPTLRRETTPAWSADSTQIAVSGRFRDDEAFGIWFVRLDGPGVRRRVTTAGSATPFDTAPAFSPDGKRLAFIRTISTTRGDVYVQHLTDGLEPSGNPSAVTNGQLPINALAWLDDQRIVFCAGRRAQRRLRIVEVASGRMAETAGFGEGADSVSIARNGNLVYARESAEINLWRFDLSSAQDRPQRLAASTYETLTPAYSHDGRRIAFASTRSGLEEIWVADADGTHAMQLTRIGSGHTTNPRWAPDDHAVLFNSFTPRSNLYVVDVNDGSLKRITDDPADAAEPSWSRDGKWIYFGGSTKTGRPEVYRIPAAGGPTLQITRNGGLHAEESPDRKWLYYSKNGDSPSSIWKVPRDGGEETLVIEGLSYSNNFILAEKGIYFISGALGIDGRAAVEFYDYSTSRRKVLTAVEKSYSYGLALSPDGRWLVHPLVDHVSGNLMLVENYR